jgi:hypothetical protein
MGRGTFARGGPRTERAQGRPSTPTFKGSVAQSSNAHALPRCECMCCNAVHLPVRAAAGCVATRLVEPRAGREDGPPTRAL